jgi:SAM-dependent methyltransferase
MPLLSLTEIAGNLICPQCKSSFADPGNACTACGAAYPTVGGQPVLVQFDQSIIAERDVTASNAGSAIRRSQSRGAKRALLRALTPENRVAAGNADKLITLARLNATRPRILIVGGASAGEGTKALYRDQAIDLIAFDIYASDLTQFVADAHQIPLSDETVDAVWIQAVLEHVLDPGKVVGEIHRVLKPHGLVYAETPFLQQVHEGAYDFTRFTESGHRWLFRQFEEVASGVVLGPASQLLWSIDHVVRGTFRSVRAGIVAKMLFSWLAMFDRIIPRSYASDAASAVYFLGRKSDVALSPKDMVAYYKGAHTRRP